MCPTSNAIVLRIKIPEHKFQALTTRNKCGNQESSIQRNNHETEWGIIQREMFLERITHTIVTYG